MASNHSSAIPTIDIETPRASNGPIKVYIVSYNAAEWGDRVRLLDGTLPPDDDWASLGGYRSLSLAKDIAIEWALKQLQDRLERHNPPFETERARDAAFDEWEKSESTEDDVWLYTISKGDKTLFTQVQTFTLYDRHRLGLH